MGFMDKAKKLAEQAQQKVDEVQSQLNERQQGGSAGTAGAPAAGEAVDYDIHGRPVTPADEVVGETPAAEPAPTPMAAPESLTDVDRSADKAPKLTGGDPLAG